MSNSAFDGFAVFDIETTGLSPAKHHRVIEIGIVRLDEELDVIEEWETLINPDRDIGASDIHGLTGADLIEAPTFEDLIVDIWQRFENAIPVAHNFSFDGSFIRSEFARLGIDLPDFDGLCTLRLARSLGLAYGRLRLPDVCRAMAIPLAEWHSAGSDARMCAKLLRKIAEHTKLENTKPPVHCQELWKRKATPLGVTRKKSRERPIQSPLQNIAEHLGSVSVESTIGEDAFSEYLLALDRILEDRIIDDSEADDLASLAAEKGFSAEDITLVHNRYVSSLAALVLSDSIVTEDERRDLNRVAGLLGVDTATVDDLLNTEPDHKITVSEDL